MRSGRTWLCLVLLAGEVAAQSAGGNYRVIPQRISSGAGIARTGDYEVRGTIAQSDASVTMVGGDFRVTGGFHRGITTPPSSSTIFRSGFEGS